MKFMEFKNGLLINCCGLCCVILSLDQSYCHRLQHDMYFLTSTSRLNEQVVDKIILQLNRVYPQILTNEEAEKVIWGVLLCLWLLCCFRGSPAQLPSPRTALGATFSQSVSPPACWPVASGIFCKTSSHRAGMFLCAKWSWERTLSSAAVECHGSLPWSGARSCAASPWQEGTYPVTTCLACLPPHEVGWSGTPADLCYIHLCPQNHLY